MKAVVIIQARMTSTRLPGKILLPLGKKLVLHHVLDRALQIKGIDTVCLAVPIGQEHEPVVQAVKDFPIHISRGDELDVLDRYYQAAKALQADVIMRITSDCPLINPTVCEQVLNAHLTHTVDYTCNNLTKTWPHGFDCEVFNFSILEKAHQRATTAYEREHVTPWIREHATVQNVACTLGDFSHYRWTLDTPEDYTHLQFLFEHYVAS